MDIVATFQRGGLSLGSSPRTFLDKIVQAATRGSGELHFLEHDFFQPSPEGDFDCIVNVLSFQILAVAMWPQAAKVHWEALKPGGHAFFDTINVAQGRRALEDSLLAAGFHLEDGFANNTSAADPGCKIAHIIYGSG